MTAAERLLQLAGTTGTAGALLLLIGSGSTAGAALVDYSGLASDTAAAHLLADRVTAAPVLGVRVKKRRKPNENDEALLLMRLI